MNLYEHGLCFNIGVRVNHIGDISSKQGISIFLYELIQFILHFVHIIIESLNVIVDCSHFLKKKLIIKIYIGVDYLHLK